MSAGDVEGLDLGPEILAAALQNLTFVQDGSVQIAGGEPSLVPDIVDNIACQAHDAGVKRISIQTNGVGVDRAFLEILKTHRMSVGVSLDGTPKINEDLRGGTAQTLSAIQLFEDHRYPINITTVVSTHNVNDLPRLGALLSRYECVRSIGLDLVRPVGRATNDWLPKARQLETAYHALADVLEWANKRRSNPLFIRESRFVGLETVSDNYCPAVSGQSAVLTPDGTLYPCSSCVGHMEYACGTAFAPQFDNLSKGLQAPTPACGTCHVMGCRGRCPSRALLSKKAGALDCVLRRAEWGRRMQNSHNIQEVRHVS